jgi:hypothetical protein
MLLVEEVRMRPKCWVAGWMLMVLGLIACGPVVAGNVRIEKKTEVLKSEAFGGRKAVIHTPVFHGIKDPALLKRIQESIDAGVRDATESSPEEWVNEWKAEGGGWLTDIDYRVTYDDRDLLSLVYVIGGLGAYPDETEICIVLDMKTGRRLAAKDLFKSQEELAAKVERMRAAEVEKTLQEHRAHLKDMELTEELLTAIMEPAVQSRFGVENLDTFRIDDKGVTFVYDFEFPHVSEALEPSGEYFLSYEELRPYINPEGPLARLIT